MHAAGSGGRNARAEGADGNDDAIVLVLAPRRLPFASQNAYHAERVATDAHHLTYRVLIAKEVLLGRLAEQAHLGFHALVGLGEVRAGGDGETAHVEIGARTAGHGGGDVAIGHHDLHLGLHVRHHGGHAGGFAQNGLSVVLGEPASAPARPAGARALVRLRKNPEHVGAEALDLAGDALLHAGTERGHDHDRRDPHQDAEHGENGAHLGAHDGRKPEPDGIAEAN